MKILLILVDLFTENWKPAYTITGGQVQNFISVFSVFFPACIGILAGANVSGDLKVFISLNTFPAKLTRLLNLLESKHCYS